MLVGLVGVSTGCAQVLGLDDTKLEYRDAATDAPSVCDGQPACNSSTGRSLCGQLFGTGADAGQPIRTAAPTGGFCSALATEGPCAFTVKAMAATDYFAGASMGQTAGQMDDCGRFVVPDVDAAIVDVAVFFSNQNQFKNNATIVKMRSPLPGKDDNLEAYAVSDATAKAWSTQVTTTATPVDVTSGYLVRYTRMGAALEGEQVAKDSSNPLMNAPGTEPWAAYFTSPGLGTLDLALTATAANGTALAVLGGGSFSLEGFQVGKRCRVMGLQQLPNTFIFVLPTGC